LSGAVEGDADAEISTGFGRKVSSVRLDLDSKAATANEILRNVLGVPVTLPEWAEKDLAAITAKFSLGSLTAEGISQLRVELNAAGLAEYYPDALKEIARRPS
jgi:hypothetical protein